MQGTPTCMAELAVQDSIIRESSVFGCSFQQLLPTRHDRSDRDGRQSISPEKGVTV